MKLIIHSITDLITNSSTTIYTYSSDSVGACKEMIDAIFEKLNINQKCEDVFILTELASKYTYDRYIEDNEDIVVEDLNQLIQDITCGKVEKPNWMVKAEERNNSSGLPPSTKLHIVAKTPDFEIVATKIKEFLYSTIHESTYE